MRWICNTLATLDTPRSSTKTKSAILHILYVCNGIPQHSIGINSRFTQQCNVVFYVYADLCSLLAANSQFSILIGQKMQLTGCHNGNEMRNATCVDTKISIEWLYCSFLYCVPQVARCADVLSSYVI